MFGESKQFSIGDVKIDVENGVFTVKTPRGSIHITIEVNLRAVTKGRVKGSLNTEKFAYGLIKPILTVTEQAELRRTLHDIERVLTDKLINFIILNQEFTARDLRPYVQLSHGHIVTVDNRQLAITA